MSRCEPGGYGSRKFRVHQITYAAGNSSPQVVDKYARRTSKWVYSGCESVEDHSYSPEDMMDIPAYQVCCRICEHPILWPDGTVVNTLGEPSFEDWLEALADDWERQKEERIKLDGELEEAKQDINPVGHLAEIEARLKALGSVNFGNCKFIRKVDPNEFK